MVFKLSFPCQSPVSPQFPQPMGAPFTAVVKWGDWSSTHTEGRNFILDPSIPHLPRAKGDFKGICFFPSLFASRFYFSFILNFPWSSHSVTVHFISLSPRCIWDPTQNMSPSGFPVLFLQGSIGGSQFRDFFADNAGVVTSEAKSVGDSEAQCSRLIVNRASDSPIWEWDSAWQVSVPRPRSPSPRVSLPYRVSFHLHSPARASHPSWRLQTLTASPTWEGRARWVPPVCPHLSKPRTVCQGILIQTTTPNALIPVGRKSASRWYTNSCLGSFFFFFFSATYSSQENLCSPWKSI